METHSKAVPRIQVIVRKRPMNNKESKKGDVDIVEKRGPDTIVVKE